MEKQKPKNAPNYYPMPERTAEYGESIIVLEWHDYDSGKQRTEYKGNKTDLIAVGLVPEKMFDEVGKSKTKTGRLELPEGGHRKVVIRKRAGDQWQVSLTHPAGQPPYESDKAKCTDENKYTFGKCLDKPAAPVAPDAVLFGENIIDLNAKKNEKQKQRDISLLMRLNALAGEIEDAMARSVARAGIVIAIGEIMEREQYNQFREAEGLPLRNPIFS